MDGMNQQEREEKLFALRGQLVLGIIGVMIAVQALRAAVSDETDVRLVLAFAFIPASFARLFDAADVLTTAQALVDRGLATPQDIALLLGPRGGRLWTPVTYAFLHGGWAHLLFNTVWLAAFGSAVARRFGTVRFLLFFAAAAIGGVVAHCLAHAFDFAPLVGASAVVSGAMGAAARFTFSPGAPLGPGGERGNLAAYMRPALPLAALLRDRRPLTFLVLWFASNFIFGVVATPVGVADATIAWEAHIGGFLVGLLFFPAFDPVRDAPEAA